MSLLQEYIVYIWLFPVFAEICLPLAMLMGWFSTKALSIFLLNKTTPAIAAQS